MKKAIWIGVLTLFTAIMVLSSCSFHRGNIGHSIITDVQLSGSNYKVVASVTGEANADYFFGVGPAKQNLLDRARRNMIKKANLTGSAKAVINITTDIKHSGFLMWSQKTAYVSGEVIEFLK